jgi:hypothetical protein
MDTAPAYDGESAATFVIMSQSLRKKRIVFVEGICEVKLLAHLFPSCEEQFIPCKGHLGVKSAHSVVQQWNQKEDNKIESIFFIDRDYANTNEEMDFLKTHFRDIEIDIYCTKAIIRLLREKATKNKLTNHEPVFENILQLLRPISILRHLNAKENLLLPLCKIGIEKLAESGSNIEPCRLVGLVNQKCPLGKEKHDELLQKIESFPEIDLRIITRGHDVSIVLGKWLRHKIGSRNANETDWKSIEENIRLTALECELSVYSWMRELIKHLNLV